MAKKYIKCPRCELNYILEGEDYCSVCKNEMKHHESGEEDELIDFDDMELCPVCGQNYIKEDQTMCDECRKKRKSEGDDDSEVETHQEDDWEEEDSDLVSAGSDIDADDEFNHGFEDVDVTEEDPFKVDDELLDDTPIDFAEDDDFDGEDESEEPSSNKDDFEEVDVSDVDDDDEDEEDDDFDDDDTDDMLTKRK